MSIPCPEEEISDICNVAESPKEIIPTTKKRYHSDSSDQTSSNCDSPLSLENLNTRSLTYQKEFEDSPKSIRESSPETEQNITEGGPDHSQFYIEVDASTVANLKAGTQYTLVPVETNQLKPFNEEQLPPNLENNKENQSNNKGVYIQMSSNPVAIPFTQSDISNSSSTIGISGNSLTTFISDKQKTLEGEAIEIQCNSQGDSIGSSSFISASPETVIKCENSGREDYTLNKSHYGETSDNSNIDGDAKNLTYTPLMVRDYLQQAPIHNGHFETPRMPHFQSPLLNNSSLPIAATPYSLHRVPAVYTTSDISNNSFSHPNLSGNYPRNVNPASQHVWLPYPQSHQGAYATNLSNSVNVGTPPVNSNMCLNSSGEEGQNSSPEYSRAHNASANAEVPVDLASVQRGNVIPQDGQIPQFVGPLDTMRYFVPFNGRENHNEKERRRRSRIKTACQTLRSLVPELSEKTDKATVFEFTVQYLLHLKSRVGVKYDKEFMEKYSPYRRNSTYQ